MRLIDADALKRNFEANVPAFAQDMVPGICYIIDRARTIDAVQVVRCKDCKYYKENTLACSRYGLEDDDYCSWAERRES